mmetsp:Transcript_61473/g.165148  ORF Transcript_61473/g.165148 Transcript_61473/m.165148 type:complete len:121 (-) Transcript_61473:30-392(-)
MAVLLSRFRSGSPPASRESRLATQTRGWLSGRAICALFKASFNGPDESVVLNRDSGELVLVGKAGGLAVDSDSPERRQGFGRDLPAQLAERSPVSFEVPGSIPTGRAFLDRQRALRVPSA